MRFFFDSQLLNESIIDSESSDDNVVDHISANSFGDDIVTFKENIVRLDHSNINANLDIEDDINVVVQDDFDAEDYDKGAQKKELKSNSDCGIQQV